MIIKSKRKLIKHVVLLLTVMCGFVYSEAATNYVPAEVRSELAANPSANSNIYIVTSREAVEGVIVDAKMKSVPMLFYPGDTLFITETGISPERGVIKESSSLVVLSLSEKKFAFVPSRAVTNIYKVEKFLAERQKSDEDSAARDEVKKLVSGNNSFPLSATIAILIIIGCCVFSEVMISRSGKMLRTATDSIDIKKYRMLLMLAAVSLTVLFVLQFGLFYNGQKTLSGWFKGDIRNGNVLVTMGLMFVKGFSMLAVLLWEFAMLYRTLGRLSLLCGGRGNYSLSIILWILATVSEIIAAFFFPSRMLVVGGVAVALILFDCIWTILSFRRSVDMLVTSAVLCVASAVSLTISLINVISVVVWLVIMFLLLCLFTGNLKPPTIVGTVTNRMGASVGKIYSDGTIYFTGGGHSSVNEVSGKVNMDYTD